MLIKFERKLLAVFVKKISLYDRFQYL